VIFQINLTGPFLAKALDGACRRMRFTANGKRISAESDTGLSHAALQNTGGARKKGNGPDWPGSAIQAVLQLFLPEANVGIDGIDAAPAWSSARTERF
jgi:hypothetical protein